MPSLCDLETENNKFALLSYCVCGPDQQLQQKPNKYDHTKQPHFWISWVFSHYNQKSYMSLGSKYQCQIAKAELGT